MLRGELWFTAASRAKSAIRYILTCRVVGLQPKDMWGRVKAAFRHVKMCRGFPGCSG